MTRCQGLQVAALTVLAGCGPRTLTAILPAPVDETVPDANVITVPDATAAGDDCSGPERTGALAERPPMGWNGWNHFKCDAAYNESEVMAVADAMVQSGMSAAGYEYVNIDDCWATGRGPDGTVVADPLRYPHGIAYVARYVHDRGLKLGIWSSSGPCAHEPQSLGYEEVDAATFASWGVDYVKYNNCIAGPEQEAAYRRMGAAIVKTGRPMVYSISAEHFDPWMPTVGQLWRVARSIDPNWESVKTNIDTNAPLAAVGPQRRLERRGHARSGQHRTHRKRGRAHFAVWAAMASPLLAGNEIATMTPSTAALLTNRELIAVDQDSLGLQAARVRTETNVDIFAKPLGTCGARAVVILNRAEVATNVQIDWSEIWLGPGMAAMRDLFQHTDRPPAVGGTTVTVGAHDAVALEIIGEEVPTPKGDAYLSDLPWTYVVNGWGPAERDSSNGEMLPRDGNPMTIRGKTYAKGLGVHAAALVRFRLGKAVLVSPPTSVSTTKSAVAAPRSSRSGRTAKCCSTAVQRFSLAHRRSSTWTWTSPIGASCVFSSAPVPMATGRTTATGPTQWCTVRLDYILNVRPKLAAKY